MRITSVSYCQYGDECGGRDFYEGELVFYSEEYDNYYCNACAAKLQKEYEEEFEKVIYQER